MDAGTGPADDNCSEQLFSPKYQSYRPPTYADFAEDESFFYTCIDCGDRYFLESSLNLHLSRASVSITYFCKQCDKYLRFQNRCNFLAHLREHPKKDKEAISVSLRPLPVCIEESGNFESKNEDANQQVNSAKNSTPTKVKKAFVSKILDSSISFPKSNVKLLSANAKSGEVKVIIREQQKIDSADQNVTCKECGTAVENIRHHFLEDNKPLNPRIRCPSCDQLLPTKCSLKAHIRIHLKKPPFVCPDCMKEFTLFELFMVHLRYFCFHLDKCPRFSCQACPGVFPSLTSLEVHLASRHVKPVYKCMACPRAFFELKLLNEHKLQSHGDIRVPTKFFEQCQLCPQKLLTKSCLFLHIHEHVTSKSACFYSYKCSHCQLVTDSKKDFASHRLTCPDSQNDVSAFALAKLAKASLTGDVVSENNSVTNSRFSITVCLPSSCSKLSSGSGVTSVNGKVNNLTGITTAKEEKSDVNVNKAVNFLPYVGKQVVTVSQEQNYAKQFIPQKVYKACGWHPRKCLMCRNELSVGTLQAWQNIPANYEGCHKWKLGNKKDIPYKSLLLNKVSPRMTWKRSFKKNCLALNGPLQTSKFHKSPSISDTYLCHICKHSLQIDHNIIRKHFRQQHSNVEIMSVRPLLQKLDFRNANVPLEQLRFSVKPSKVLQTMVNRNKVNGIQSAKKILLQARHNQIQNYGKNAVGAKQWLTCAQCSFKTKNKKTLRKHVNSHKRIRYECKECKLEFVSEPSFNIHLVMRHGLQEGKKLRNDTVKKKVVKRRLEEKSLAAKSSDDDTPGILKCKVCYKTFKNNGDLQKHFRIHGMAFLLLNKDETVWRKV